MKTVYQVVVTTATKFGSSEKVVFEGGSYSKAADEKMLVESKHVLDKNVRTNINKVIINTGNNKVVLSVDMNGKDLEEEIHDNEEFVSGTGLTDEKITAFLDELGEKKRQSEKSILEGQICSCLNRLEAIAFAEGEEALCEKRERAVTYNSSKKATRAIQRHEIKKHVSSLMIRYKTKYNILKGDIIVYNTFKRRLDSVKLN